MLEAANFEATRQFWVKEIKVETSRRLNEHDRRHLNMTTEAKLWKGLALLLLSFVAIVVVLVMFEGKLSRRAISAVGLEFKRHRGEDGQLGMAELVTTLGSLAHQNVLPNEFLSIDESDLILLMESANMHGDTDLLDETEFQMAVANEKSWLGYLRRNARPIFAATMARTLMFSLSNCVDDHLIVRTVWIVMSAAVGLRVVCCSMKKKKARKHFTYRFLFPQHRNTVFIAAMANALHAFTDCRLLYRVSSQARSETSFAVQSSGLGAWVCS